MGFHFGPDFHVSSDPQIHEFIAVCIAAECFFYFGPDFHVSQDQQDSRIFRHIEYS